MRHISADDQNHSHHLGLYVVLVLAMVLTACTTPTPLPISTNTLKPTHYPTAINVPETTPLSPTPISLEPTPNSIPHNLPELVYDINPGSAVLVKAPSDFVELNGQLYFIAGDEDGHRRLWRTDGTTVGTKVVINIDTGTIGDGVLGLTRAGSNLFFFAASGPSNAFELWRSDGTAEGTEVIAPLGYDPNRFTPENYRPQIAAVGATLYFVSGIDQRGGTLYRSDGTKAGTLPLLFVESLGNNPLPIRSLTPSGDLLFFEAQHHSPTKSTLELAIWRTDGTKKGTQLIYEGSYGDLTSVGRLVFFPGFNEGLLVSDGTLEHTHMVKSIRIGTGESLRYGTALGDQFFLYWLTPNYGLVMAHSQEPSWSGNLL
jgi:ELWxxDGT repeat protein